MEYVFQNFDTILVYTFLPVYFLFLVPLLAGLWRIFEKAGYAGIHSFLPLWNVFVLTRVSGLSILWALTLFIPGFNIITSFALCIALAKRFNRSWGTALGLFLFPIIFFPWLGFSKAEYLSMKVRAKGGEEVRLAKLTA